MHLILEGLFLFVKGLNNLLIFGFDQNQLGFEEFGLGIEDLTIWVALCGFSRTTD